MIIKIGQPKANTRRAYCEKCRMYINARETTGQEVCPSVPRLKNIKFLKCDVCGRATKDYNPYSYDGKPVVIAERKPE